MDGIINVVLNGVCSAIMAVRFVFFAFYHGFRDDRIAGRSARGSVAPIPKPKILAGDDQNGRREVVAAACLLDEHQTGEPHLLP